MVAQDTGAAITGPARADLYWGAGDDAARIAGRLRHQGRFIVLIPRELDLVAVGRKMPLPRRKPVFLTAVASHANDGTTGTVANKDANRTEPARVSVGASPLGPDLKPQKPLSLMPPKSSLRPGS